MYVFKREEVGSGFLHHATGMNSVWCVTYLFIFESAGSRLLELAENSVIGTR